MLREKLLNAKLEDEAARHNIPHVTVVHIHNSDATTPEKMLKALPKLPGVLNVTLKNFYATEAALPNGIQVSFKTVSIVELGFAGNVLREIYRIDLQNGSVLNVATNSPVGATTGAAR